jgi:hypothetical protein
MLRGHFLQLSSYSGAALILSFHLPQIPGTRPRLPPGSSILASGLLFLYSR